MIRKIPLGKQVRSTIYIHKLFEYAVIPSKVLTEAKDIGLINYFNYLSICRSLGPFALFLAINLLSNKEIAIID